MNKYFGIVGLFGALMLSASIVFADQRSLTIDAVKTEQLQITVGVCQIIGTEVNGVVGTMEKGATDEQVSTAITETIVANLHDDESYLAFWMLGEARIQLREDLSNPDVLNYAYKNPRYARSDIIAALWKTRCDKLTGTKHTVPLRVVANVGKTI